MITSALVAGLGLAGLGGLSPRPPGLRLVIREQRVVGNVFRRLPLRGDETVTMKWMHSVDKTPWTEYYTIDEGEFLLDCTDLQLMGAGTPFNAPRTEIVGDEVRLCGLNERFPELRWIHSHRVHHRIYLDDELVLPTSAVPHHTQVEMIVAGTQEHS